MEIFFTFKNPQPLGRGHKVKAFFPESGHVAYQIKGKEM